MFSNSSYAPKLWLQQSGGAFSPARLPSWGSAVQDALVADWNGDGLTDLAFTDTEAKSATLMLNVCLP
ncbi:FG-GAP repeat domain-containing protein [Myxococcus stipitatus]|uniref:FG-GAP repeat domain-containing protein n=1 Tax=Myxococcus stipitatus TaxID=83455 RepID=UPI00030677EC|nr:VCBS repeat-containing protein [Myxococcus stipitatus]